MRKYLYLRDLEANPPQKEFAPVLRGQNKKPPTAAARFFQKSDRLPISR